MRTGWRANYPSHFKSINLAAMKVVREGARILSKAINLLADEMAPTSGAGGWRSRDRNSAGA